ncbi:hypothetical protein FBU30_003383 [Linnemannia zychae]|nr:hypothetical protein FBU30_003383 [Linnemannia zychae]
MAVNAIRYVILEDMHRQFAVRARERKAKKAARRQERKEERQREIERKKRTQEAIENIRKMEALQNQTEGASTETHHSSIFRRHFTVPHGVGLRLPALFHRRGSDVTAKSQNVSNIFTTESTVKERSPTYGSSTSTESIQLRTPIRDDPVGEGHLKAIQNAPEDADTIKGDNIQRYRYFPKGLRESVVRWYIVFGRICGFKKAADCARIAAPMANLKKQREADKELAYKESMQEYRRRLRFSFGMFMCFWLLGAVIYRTVEPWSYGQAMYFSFVAFSSIGYGDLVPLSLAGRAIFLAYCLIGIVTLTSLASIISEVLSKSLRRHVVQTQLRRSERFAEQRHNIERRVSDTDLEQGVTAAEDHENGFSSENDQHMERMQTLQTLATTVAAGLSDSSRSPDSSQGSLRNLVQVSRDFDTLLQKVLGLDYASDNIPTATTNVGNSSNTNAKISLPLEPDRILDYLEKEEEELSDSSFFSPSISRDITSTSSIHRNTLATLGRNFMDLKANGTYHGPGPSTSSNTSSSESQFNIRAWPNSPSPASSSSSAATKSASITAHRHNADGSVTISAIHWRHLIEYSKQFRILTNTCEEALQKLLVWEATESRMRMRRRLIRERQKRILQTRRRRMFELGGTYGAIDDDIEDEEELEELDEWFGEGDSNNDDGYEEDNEENNIDDLDQDQEGIAKTLLGSIGVEQSTPILDPDMVESRVLVDDIDLGQDHVSLMI